MQHKLKLETNTAYHNKQGRGPSLQAHWMTKSTAPQGTHLSGPPVEKPSSSASPRVAFTARVTGQETVQGECILHRECRFSHGLKKLRPTHPKQTAS